MIPVNLVLAAAVCLALPLLADDTPKIKRIPAHPTTAVAGQDLFREYCAVCHGTGGAGDGPIVPKYPNPPAYQVEKSKALPDGNMFHVITFGRNNMPSHAAQVSTEDRWKVILYIRKLQGKTN